MGRGPQQPIIAYFATRYILAVPFAILVSYTIPSQANSGQIGHELVIKTRTIELLLDDCKTQFYPNILTDMSTKSSYSVRLNVIISFSSAN